jgi:hypothetical protein
MVFAEAGGKFLRQRDEGLRAADRNLLRPCLGVETLRNIKGDEKQEGDCESRYGHKTVP